MKRSMRPYGGLYACLHAIFIIITQAPQLSYSKNPITVTSKAFQLMFALTLAGLHTNSYGLSYVENINGDLDGLNSPTLALDAGINTISGSNTYFTGLSPQTDFDTFLFTVPNGMRIDSVYYDFFNTDITGLTWFQYVINLQDKQPSVIRDMGVNKLSVDVLTGVSPAVLDTGYLPSGDGLTYYWDHRFTHLSGETGGGTWDYTTTINVAAIPIPSAIWLFYSGLLGLIGISRSKKVA